MAYIPRTPVFADRDQLLGMTPNPAVQGDGVERLVEMALHGLPEDRLRGENIIQVIVRRVRRSFGAARLTMRQGNDWRERRLLFGSCATEIRSVHHVGRSPLYSKFSTEGCFAGSRIYEHSR